jgi:hypothetical protein
MPEHAGLEVKFDICFRKVVGSNLGGIAGYPPLQANIGMTPSLTQDLFLPNPLQFTSHPSTTRYDIYSFKIYSSYSIKFSLKHTNDNEKSISALFKNDILTPLHPLELQGGFVTGRRE